MNLDLVNPGSVNLGSVNLPPVELIRIEVRVRGVVQGVGFRPTVFRLATEEGLAGFIGNDSAGVVIEVEGARKRLDAFLDRLRTEAPPLARIDHIEVHPLDPVGESGFRIVASHDLGASDTGIPADAATCSDCLRELFDPRDRRFRYPFLNCTNCGPRYTITRHIPYDRPETSMAGFKMCTACQTEYDSPDNRRFHAQPNACPACGPRLALVDCAGQPIRGEDSIAETIAELLRGAVIAIKGLGGFHLCVDATNAEAVERLRTRKHRFGKPLAVMVRNLDAARQLAEMTAEEEALLMRVERPIVLVRARVCARVKSDEPVGNNASSGAQIAANVAPGVPWIGLFLPYTPLHHLLLADERITALVMTSANLSEEPIAIDNTEARVRLGAIADAFLVHDREILQRCDDSVMAIVDGAPQLIRRARGFVPLAVELPVEAPPMLAVGGQLKNVFALARGHAVYQSQHLGDLENLAGLNFFEEALAHLKRVFDIEPECIVHDLHPGYLSTEWALAQGLPVIAVQHHHAHIAACMAEHGLAGPVIGLALDGTGYGTDGTVWGGEALIATLGEFERFAHLAYVPMPGSTAAIREPNRMALGALVAAGIDVNNGRMNERLGLTDKQSRLMQTMIAKRINTPLTSSCGRLFDAVAAVVLGRHAVDYEAQAAIELEGVARADTDEAGYSFAFSEAEDEGPLRVQTAPMWHALLSDMDRGTEPSLISERFHQGLADAWTEVAVRARIRTGIEQVALSGGVFHNRLFSRLLRRGLERQRFEVFVHRRVSPGDGGLSYGQVAIGTAQLLQHTLLNL